MNKNLVQFFQDNDNRFSMTRLMVFASFFPASFVVCYIRSAESLGVYLAAYAGLAANNKWAEKKKSNVIPIKPTRKSKAD